MLVKTKYVVLISLLVALLAFASCASASTIVDTTLVFSGADDEVLPHETPELSYLMQEPWDYCYSLTFEEYGDYRDYVPEGCVITHYTFSLGGHDFDINDDFTLEDAEAILNDEGSNHGENPYFLGGTSNLEPYGTFYSYDDDGYPLWNESAYYAWISTGTCGTGCEIVPVTIYYSSPAVTQHVTVSYDESTDNFNVLLSRNGIYSSAFLKGKIFSWLPVVSNSSSGVSGSRAVEYEDGSYLNWFVSVPAHWLIFGLDYEMNVRVDGETQTVTWSSSDIPVIEPPPPVVETPLPSFTPTPLPTTSDGLFDFHFDVVNPSDFKLPLSGATKEEMYEQMNDSRNHYSLRNDSLLYDIQQNGMGNWDEFLLGVDSFMSEMGKVLFMPITVFSRWCTQVYYFLSSALLSFSEYVSFPWYVMGEFVKIVPAVIMNICMTVVVFFASLRLFKQIVPLLGGVFDFGVGVGSSMFSSGKDIAKKGFSGASKASENLSGKYSSWSAKRKQEKLVRDTKKHIAGGGKK